MMALIRPHAVELLCKVDLYVMTSPSHGNLIVFNIIQYYSILFNIIIMIFKLKKNYYFFNYLNVGMHVLINLLILNLKKKRN